MKYVWIFHIFYMTNVIYRLFCSDKTFFDLFLLTEILKFEMHSSEMRISELQKHEYTVAKNISHIRFHLIIRQNSLFIILQFFQQLQ